MEALLWVSSYLLTAIPLTVGDEEIKEIINYPNAMNLNYKHPVVHIQKNIATVPIGRK